MNSEKKSSKRQSETNADNANADVTNVQDTSAEKSDDNSYEYSFVEETNENTKLDSHLRRILSRIESDDDLTKAVVSSGEDGTLMIDVLAKLRDPQQPVPGLKIASLEGDIATGMVAVENFEQVSQDPNVMILEGSRKVSSTLEFSVSEIRAAQSDLQAALPPGSKTIDGAGVIVGVVDFGCDFAHRNFSNPDGTSRILFLWDQSSGANNMSPAPFNYGREFTRNSINAALQTPNPYNHLFYNPGTASHGTHVMDIAAGNGLGTGFPGVAPKADIIFVQLSAGDFSATQSFGSSRRLVDAVRYIFAKADQLGKSAVINLSLGTHGGPHDGSTLAEMDFDRLLQTPGRAIVISAGNSFERNGHATGRITSGNIRVLRWEIPLGDPSPNEMEIWYDDTEELEVTLIAPDGKRFPTTRVGKTTKIQFQGVEAGQIIHNAKDPSNGDRQVDILLDPILPTGIWQVELRALSSQGVNFHAWIERDDNSPGVRRQSVFTNGDADPTYTVGSISCGRNTIVVGSYNARAGNQLSFFTAEGPTRDGKQKPEVSAPGHEIVAAASRTGNQSTTMSGTSMAAPHVAGLVALLMQAANKKLNINEIRKTIMETARKNPPANQSWNSRYGVGRVDSTATVLTQFQAAPALVSVAETEQRIAQSALALTNGYGVALGQSVKTFIDSMAESRVRVRLQLEIEPINK